MLMGLHRQLFALIHGNRLIYNTCWEDPLIDRQLLGLDQDSNVVVITSAGCNALDYLLDGPGSIHAVDVNFRQNALLSLKLALIRHGDFDALFTLFGQGGGPAYREIYEAIRPDLQDWVRGYWDTKISYFNPEGVRKSFYWRSAAGDFAWVFLKLLFNGNKRSLAVALLEADCLEEQDDLYRRVEPHLFGGGISWLLRQPAALAFVGVPTQQLRLVDQQYPGGLAGCLRHNLRQVFTTVPIRDNYFWRVYLTGRYTVDCCPNYLQAANFLTLKERLDRVSLHTDTVTGFLKTKPGEYSHFVLLDHQDWLAWHDLPALVAEWRQIFRNSRPGTRILLRSAGPDLSFLPDSVTGRLRFFPELTRPLHQVDRVGTYGSLHLAEVV
jgi:S-adenosylmethionine-diacylglycerol 3-amino-3-carboxypropyl transferase